MSRKVKLREKKDEQAQILNALRIPIEEWIDSIDIPKPDLKDKAAALRVYRDFCLGVAACDLLFDRPIGLSVWCRGQVLLRLKPLTSGQKGLCEHGEWGQFCKAIGISDSTALLYRRCAETFSRQDAIKLGYQGMREQLEPKHDELAEPPAAQTPSTNENVTTKKVKARRLTVKTYPEIVGRVVEEIRFLLKQLPKLKDAYDSPETTVETLEAQICPLEAARADIEKLIAQCKELALQIKEVSKK